MVKTRHLLREEVTFSDVNTREDNVLHLLTYHDQQTRFFAELERQHDLIATTVAYHMNIASDNCSVASLAEWLHGSFNVCIPVHIKDGRTPRVILRIPLPYRVGEKFQPGNADEKIRCEAGAYAWLSEYCPTVPIPKLYGFGLSTGKAVRSHRTRGEADAS